MEQHGDLIIRCLTRRGHKLTIITTSHPSGIVYQEDNGVNIHYLPGLSPLRYTNTTWERFNEKFEELHKAGKFDIVLSQSIAGVGYLKKLKPKFNLPCVIVAHGTYINEIKTRFRNLGSFSSLFRLIAFVFLKFPSQQLKWFRYLNRADCIIAVSNQLKRDFARHFFVDESKIKYIPNGIDINLFVPGHCSYQLRRQLGISEKDKVILSLAHMTKQKGFQFLIKAMNKVVARDKMVKLVLVGDGDYKYSLEELVNRLGLQRHVIFTGFVSNEYTVHFYNLADLFIIPTIRIEGFPFVLTEAMACQKPVIASRIGGIPSAIDDGINGILVPPGDVNVLAEKIILLLENKELADKLARNAKEKAMNEFNQEKMVEETLRILEKAIIENKR